MLVQSKWSWNLCTLLLVLTTLLGCTEAQLRVYAETGLRIEPVDNRELNSFVVITCHVELTNSTVPTRWIAPNGQIIDRSFGRYSVGQGANENGVWSTLLAVQNVSYMDAGHYTCEVVPRSVLRSQCECVDFPFSATTELQLQVNLVALQEELTAEEGTTSSVELGCEMSGYLRPDVDIQWYKDDHLFSLKGARHSVSIKDGTIGTGQNGGIETVHSRLSVLTIHHPTVADSGVYGCRVRGTTAETSMSLTVAAPQVTGPVTNTPDPNKGQSTDADVTTAAMEKPTREIMITNEKGGKDLTGDANGNNPNVSPSSSVNAGELAIIVCTTSVTTAVLSSLLTLLVTCFCLKNRKRSKLSGAGAQLVPSSSNDIHLDCSYTSADSVGVGEGLSTVAMISETTKT